MSSTRKKRSRIDGDASPKDEGRHPVAPTSVGSTGVERCLHGLRSETYDAALDVVVRARPRAGGQLRELQQRLTKSPYFSTQGLASQAQESLKAALASWLQWKLLRGVFRPGLTQRFGGAPPSVVYAALTSALAVLDSPSSWTLTPIQSGADGASSTLLWHPTVPSVMKAISILSELPGVGPATATAWLSWTEHNVPPPLPKEGLPCEKGGAPAEQLARSGRLICLRQEVCPFMSDEALKALGLPLAYNISTCRSLLEAVHSIQLSLIEQAGNCVGDLQPPTARRLSEALWATEVLQTTRGVDL